ncbi:hypothetical protein ONZ45_g13290 [Pleurotus djamor]|nr:hypothetical protein ONZ45_g13290 [Pleurotus djamor]
MAYPQTPSTRLLLSEMAMDIRPLVAITASELQIQNNVKSYLSLAAVTILYYDYLLTLPMEIDRYWSLKVTTFSWTRFLFYLNRYTALLAHVPVIVAYFWDAAPFDKVEICRKFHSFHSYYVVAAQLIIGVILTIRTHALYNRTRKFLYILAPVIISLVALGSWAIASSDDGHANPDPLQVQAWPRIGCIESLTQSGGVLIHAYLLEDLAIAWSSLLAFDLLIYFLTLRKAIGAPRPPGGYSLVQIILRDASVYIAVILVVNTSIVLTLVTALKGVSTTLSSCVASIIISRLLFNLRDPALNPPMVFSTRVGSSINFGAGVSAPVFLLVPHTRWVHFLAVSPFGHLHDLPSLSEEINSFLLTRPSGAYRNLKTQPAPPTPNDSIIYHGPIVSQWPTQQLGLGFEICPQFAGCRLAFFEFVANAQEERLQRFPRHSCRPDSPNPVAKAVFGSILVDFKSIRPNWVLRMQLHWTLRASIGTIGVSAKPLQLAEQHVQLDYLVGTTSVRSAWVSMRGLWQAHFLGARVASCHIKRLPL